VAVPQSDGVETGSERIGPKHHEEQPWTTMPELTVRRDGAGGEDGIVTSRVC